MLARAFSQISSVSNEPLPVLLLVLLDGRVYGLLHLLLFHLPLPLFIVTDCLCVVLTRVMSDSAAETAD